MSRCRLRCCAESYVYWYWWLSQSSPGASGRITGDLPVPGSWLTVSAAARRRAAIVSGRPAASQARRRRRPAAAGGRAGPGPWAPTAYYCTVFCPQKNKVTGLQFFLLTNYFFTKKYMDSESGSV
jgi:hypothetical protein